MLRLSIPLLPSLTLQQGVEHAIQDFLNRTLESTDLQVSLDEIDELETIKPSSEKEAWRPSRVVDDDIQVYRFEIRRFSSSVF